MDSHIFQFNNGAPLERLNSFDRLMLSLTAQEEVTNEDLDSAAELVQLWFKRKMKMHALINKMITSDMQKNINIVLDVMNSINKQDIMFDDVQSILVSKDFKTSLTHILVSLPRDPILKNSNKHCRSSQFIASALIICIHANSVLVTAKTDGTEVLDTSFEARVCQNASSLLMHSLIKLLSILNTSNSTTPPPTVKTFRHDLLLFRFSVRYFHKAMNDWRSLDLQRMGQSMLGNYRDCYKMYVVYAKEQTEEAQTLADTMKQQLSKMRVTMEKILGKSTANSKIEEAEAMVDSSFEELIMNSTGGSVESVQSSGSAGDSALDVERPTSPTKKKIDEEFKETSSSPYSSMDEGEQEILNKREMIFLERLAEAAGMENEKLAHELCLNPQFNIPTLQTNFKLPQDFGSRFRDNSAHQTSQEDLARMLMSDPQKASSMLKKNMLAVISDTLYWSLKKNPFEFNVDTDSQEDIMLQLKVGMFIPMFDNGKSFGATIQAIQIDEATITIRYVSGMIEENVELSRIRKPATPRDPEPLISALKDLINNVCALVPSRTDIHTVLSSAIDQELLTQMLTHNACSALDLFNIFDLIFQQLCNLLEPSRSSVMQTWISNLKEKFSTQSFEDCVVIIPYIFEVCQEIIEEIRVELANYFVTLLLPAMEKSGPTFLKSKFEKRIAETLKSLSGREGFDDTLVAVQAILPKTMGILLPGVHPRVDIEEKSNLLQLPVHISEDDLKEAGLTVFNEQGKVNTQVVAACLFTRLIQVPVRLNTPHASGVIPEILTWDAHRLAGIRDDIDMVALVATIVITIKQGLYRIIGPSAGGVIKNQDLETLQQRLDVLLRSSDIGISHVVVESLRFIKDLVRQSDTLLPAGWEQGLESSLRAAINEGSPILGLFTKRIAKVLLRGLGGQPISQMPTFNSFSAYPYYFFYSFYLYI